MLSSFLTSSSDMNLIMPCGTPFSDVSYRFNVCTCSYWSVRYHCCANGTKTCHIFRNHANGGIDSEKHVRRYGRAETSALSLPRHKNE